MKKYKSSTEYSYAVIHRFSACSLAMCLIDPTYVFYGVLRYMIQKQVLPKLNITF